MKEMLLATVCLLLVCTGAAAFDGLNKLIDDADFIVVAEIINAPSGEEWGFHADGDVEIKLVRILKGEAQPGTRAVAHLQNAPFDFGPHRYASLAQGFLRGQLYLLFLNKPGTNWHDANGKPLAVDFDGFGVDKAIWIPSSIPGSYFNLDLLNGRSVRDAVITLLNHAATEQGKSEAAIRIMIDTSSIAILDRITPALWFNGNAEEAATFYVSIFTDRARPYPEGQSRIEHVFRADSDPSDHKSQVGGVKFVLDDVEFIALNRSAKIQGTGRVAFTLNCSLADECNYFHKKLSAGGKELGDGWLKDKFGISWYLTSNRSGDLLEGTLGEIWNSKKPLGDRAKR